MVKPEKVKKVEEIKELLKDAKGFYFADFTGLTVAEITDLRRRLREKNARMKVVKNTMTRRALEELGYEGFSEILVGPNALIVAYEDVVEPLKSIFEFKKEVNKTQLKVGYVDGELYDEKGLEKLSKLPSKDKLRAQVVGTLQAPIYGLVWRLKGMLTSFVVVLNEIKKKKEEVE